MILVDSHCHLDCLQLDKYDNDLDKAIEFAKSQDVQHMLCVNIDWEHRQRVLEIASHYPFIHASVGVHPTSDDGVDPTLEEIVAAAQHPKVVAIGETGLDYFHTPPRTEWQLERFRRHIQAAKSVNKPLIIHTRDARDDTIAILKEQNAEQVGGVMHCFTETWEMAKAAMDLGFYISFSGIVTFKNAKELQDVCKRMPLDRILIETDAPYLAPVPFRGKSNEPAYVRHVAQFIADLREQSMESIATATTENYFKLFSGAVLI